MPTQVVVFPTPPLRLMKLACFGGDSGGPFFLGNQAYGFQKAGNFTGRERGECIWAAFMAQEFIVDMQLSVLTSPS
jgi:streptogrisin C